MATVEDEELTPWNEAPSATGPTKSSYSPGDEQAQRMEGHLGPELNRKLEIAVAQIDMLRRVQKKCSDEYRTLTHIDRVAWPSAYKAAIVFLSDVLKDLEQEIKAELK